MRSSGDQQTARRDAGEHPAFLLPRSRSASQEGVMSTQDHFSSGCTDEFAELCALSTSGALSVGERRHLEQHVLECRRCASLLADYESLTSGGMARFAAVRDCE